MHSKKRDLWSEDWISRNGRVKGFFSENPKIFFFFENQIFVFFWGRVIRVFRFEFSICSHFSWLWQKKAYLHEKIQNFSKSAGIFNGFLKNGHFWSIFQSWGLENFRLLGFFSLKVKESEKKFFEIKIFDFFGGDFSGFFGFSVLIFGTQYFSYSRHRRIYLLDQLQTFPFTGTPFTPRVSEWVNVSAQDIHLGYLALSIINLTRERRSRTWPIM